MLTSFVNILLAFSSKFGYGGVLFLMTVESSFIPFPSELVIPPAAYLAQKGEMNIFLVVLAGVIGSLIGALINYYLALYLGRTIIYKLADKKIFKFLMINPKKIEKAESVFLRYGRISTFTGRLVPVIRQLISLPAGFSKMNLKTFCLFTFLGSSIWVIVLAILGYAFGSNQEMLNKYLEEISLVAILFVLVLIAVYVFRKKVHKRFLDKIFKKN